MPALILALKAAPWRAIGIGVTAALLVFAGWTVRGWRDGAEIAARKIEAAGQLLAGTQAARTQEHEDHLLADTMDKSHVEHLPAIEAVASDNRAVIADLDLELDRLRRPGPGNGGTATVRRGSDPAGDAATTAAHADRSGQCEALLIEGAGLLVEGAELLADTAHAADLAAEYARVGHAWAMKGRATENRP